jgi:hypothetical protein
MEKAQHKILPILAIISIAASILFLFLFMLTSYGVNIQRIPLSSTLFDSASNKYDFAFDNLSNNVRYNVMLRLIKKPDIDYMDVVEHKINFGIKVRLRDSTNNVILNKDINKDSKIPDGWTRDYIELYLASFEAKNQKDYQISLEFNNSEHFFNRFKYKSNVVFVEEDYDYAALPWLNLFHSLSKILLLISFLSAAITITLLVRKKRRSAAIINQNAREGR